MSCVGCGVLVACLLVASSAARDKTEAPKHVLDVGGLFPFTGASGGHGWGTLPAVTLALIHVNAHLDILRSHTLRMARYDTKVGRLEQGR